ncbi:MAG: hypothetical protein GY711_25105 [bacterium]|nr:hypothetical protein [bacterium]
MTRALGALGACVALVLGASHATGQDLTNQDECSQAGLDVRVGNGTWMWDNSGATTGVEGQDEASCYTFGLTGVQSDVWFVWRSAFNGFVIMDTCSTGGTNLDTKIAAYPAGCCPETGTAVDCNDDSCGARSTLAFATDCGESYLIQLGSFPGSADGTAFVTAQQSGPACPTEIDTDWSQSVDNSSIAPGGVACINQVLGVADNSFWRLYERAFPNEGLSAPPVVGDFEVTEVRFGVEVASSLGGVQMIDVRIRDGAGFPAGATSAPILGEVVVPVFDTDQTQQTFVTATFNPPVFVPAATRSIAVEIHVPNGQDPGQMAMYFPGSNVTGQTEDSYLSADDCVLFDPVPFSAVGFPDVMIIQDLVTRSAPAPSETIGCNYCGPSIPNSSGVGAVITARGSEQLSDNVVTLTASDLPNGVFGYFLSGPGNQSVLPGQSNGRFCLVGGNSDFLGRYEERVFNSGTTGQGSLSIDVTAVPIAGGGMGGPTERALLPGETWNFQCWFRDAPAGGQLNNFTDAVSILFR